MACFHDLSLVSNCRDMVTVSVIFKLLPLYYFHLICFSESLGVLCCSVIFCDAILVINLSLTVLRLP